MPDIKNMKKKDFMALPKRNWRETSEYTSLVLIPSKTLHESGYPFISVVGVSWMDPVEIAAESCDCVLLNMYDSRFSIDILPKSGFTHIMARTLKFRVGMDASSLFITSGCKIDYQPQS